MANVENVLVAELRDRVGKGSARQARRSGKVPAVLYGKGEESVHLLLPAHDTFLIVKDTANAIVTIKYDGKEQLALVKSVQVHPVRRDILHVDLFLITADQKVAVDVPLVIVGSSAAGTQHAQEEFQLSVKAPATAIPESIEVDVTGLEAGTVVKAGDLKLPENVECDVELGHPLVSIVAVSSAAAADGSEGESAESGSDGE